MNITILGAGVSGLTCGVVLSEAGFEVTIVARDVEETTSAAAAAIWFPYQIASVELEEWAHSTRKTFVELSHDPSTGVSLIDFELLDTGERMRVPLMDTTKYLPYLRRRFGREIVRREVRWFHELDADVVVNCAGFGARALCGDELLTPGHGIALITDPTAIDRAIARTRSDLMYVIPRQRDCVLGGYDGPTPPDESEVERILARCRHSVPELPSSVRTSRRGIRPLRPTVRLELERIDGIPVIHNYGHGGAGFTVSWGCARKVQQLVRYIVA